LHGSKKEIHIYWKKKLFPEGDFLAIEFVKLRIGSEGASLPFNHF
jgi:hypothetical protein